ncbi:conserved Plasmodium protein, unknown function [Plasmodium sp. gorilla clade G2]|uniref:conserved Plasmodium protein, unknown function n=1 Tax=Plasmodium sp. gorilla clade G2 TaxID=880535 RepID=UPI000D207A48|nr:conserved Plasmodium protein, unknown function [Plasmodium sp. gorilla clade G2]SOV17613.1 conserved Plasmodium protein, unknown function [Plasmodium sp. gorilla clade G2]
MTKGGSNHKNNKVKPIDINKKLLIIKCNDDLRKLINKENPSVDEINDIKSLLENNEVQVEKKKRNIVIPRFKICEDSEEEKKIKNKNNINVNEKRNDNINDDAAKNKTLSDNNDNYDYDDEKKYSVTKFEKPSHYIRYELYKDQVTGIKLSDGSIIHYDLLKEDEIFLEGLNSYLNIQVNDESFCKLIDKFEKLTGNSDNKEEINFKEALKAASDLKINYKSNVIKDIYTYWKNKRKKLGRPLLRMFWNNSQNSLPHYSVFRPRVKEKMTLRKHKKKNSEIIIKMQELIQDFRRLDRILRKIKQRDEKKLLLLQLNAILFDQRINEIQDKTYVCPMWNYFKDYKIEKIYKKFKKDKYYKNSYHHQYNNNNNNNINKYYYDENEYENYNIDANEDGYVNHNNIDEYMNDNMDEYMNNNIDGQSHYNYKDSICNRKINKKLKHYIMHPEQKNLLKINPNEYKNVVLIKRRGRSNRMWVDRKYVDENNINNHEINYCDLSYAFNDFVEASLTLKKNYEEDVSNYLAGKTRIPIKLDIRKRDLKNVDDFNTSLFCNNQINDDSLFNGMYDELNGERKRKRRKKKEQENVNVDENYINSHILLENMGDQFALQANNNITCDKTKMILNDCSNNNINNNNNNIICNNNLDIIQKNSTTNANNEISNLNSTNIVTCDNTSIAINNDANNSDIKLNCFINKGNKINMNGLDYNSSLLFHKNNTDEKMLNQYIYNKSNLYNMNNINGNIKNNEDNTKMVPHNILSLEQQNLKYQDLYEKYVNPNITNNNNNNNISNNNNNNNMPFPMVSRNGKYAPCIFPKEQNNKTIFHFEDMIDPLMNKDNYLFCLSKYVYVQKKILFYLEHLLNFDNYNFKSKKKELPNNKDMNIKMNTNDNINNDNLNKNNINYDAINNKKNDDFINNTLPELNGTCLKSKTSNKSIKHKTPKENNIK